MSEQMAERWIISPPGGPAGPFWGVISTTGKVLAMQVTSEKYAMQIQRMANVISGDFDTIHRAGHHLRRLLNQEFGHKSPLDEGAEDYIIRSVVEILFSAPESKSQKYWEDYPKDGPGRD